MPAQPGTSLPATCEPGGAALPGGEGRHAPWVAAASRSALPRHRPAGSRQRAGRGEGTVLPSPAPLWGRAELGSRGHSRRKERSRRADGARCPPATGTSPQDGRCVSYGKSTPRAALGAARCAAAPRGPEMRCRRPAVSVRSCRPRDGTTTAPRAPSASPGCAEGRRQRDLEAAPPSHPRERHRAEAGHVRATDAPGRAAVTRSASGGSSHAEGSCGSPA